MSKVLVILLNLAALVGFTTSHAADEAMSPAEIAVKAALTPPYSEERNAASAFVGTQNFYIGRMALTCKPLLGQPDTFPSKLVAIWQAANAPYYRASVIYQSDLLKSIPDATAQALIAENIRNSVRTSGQGAVNDQLKGPDEDKTKVCKNFVVLAADGNFNITEKTPFFSTLQDLVKEFDK